MCQPDVKQSYTLDEIIESILDGTCSEEQSLQLFDLGPEAVTLATLAAARQFATLKNQQPVRPHLLARFQSIRNPTRKRVEQIVVPSQAIRARIEKRRKGSSSFSIMQKPLTPMLNREVTPRGTQEVSL